MKVSTRNEYGRLRSVLVGSVENFSWPKGDVEFDQGISRSTYPETLQNIVPDPKVLSEAYEDLEQLSSILEDRGVQVHRPTITGPHWSYSARDILLTAGNKVIQCPTPFSSRSDELDLYPSLRKADCEIIKAPRRIEQILMANRQLEDQVMNLQATLARSRQSDRHRRYSMALLGLSILCFLPALTNDPGSLSEWRSALGSVAIIAALIIRGIRPT